MPAVKSAGMSPPEILNRHKSHAMAQFVHRPDPGTQPRPVIFGRVDRAELHTSGEAVPFTFLTYHAVFRTSGLPAGLLGWQILALGIVGDLQDWHQLDHYTAATVVLDADAQPVALVLQHHNYQRTYLFDETVKLPADGRPRIDISIRSNELYPHLPGRHNRAAVSFLNPRGWLYLMQAGPRLFLTADDITEPASEVSYDLQFLPPADAFYTFKGFLGEKRWLMGRSGPPGADYKTLPEFMPWETQLTLGYWRPGNPRDITRLKRALARDQGYLAFCKCTGAKLACEYPLREALERRLRV